MLYHSASRRTRRSNNRYLHISTPLSIVQSQDLGIKKVETEDIGIENVRIRIFVWHKSFVSKILSKKGGWGTSIGRREPLHRGLQVSPQTSERLTAQHRF